ncbi:MAG: 2-hydroxychromene-2-carboxylate isomerase [Ponticaulis sp.]|nr:2-hydroxychromene-2-carboxylate isomerase [Ponticaulis sp.]
MITFWYEFASTYSYLSAMRIDALAEAKGVEVEWKPFLLGPIFAAQGWNTSPFNIYPAKGQYMWRDMERRAAKYGIPIKRPVTSDGGWPRSSVKAARLALVGLNEGWGQEFSRLVYIGEFSDHADITDEEILSNWIRQAGGDPLHAFKTIQSDALKGQLRQNTEDAISAGVFGAPSFTVGEELFWGDDRLEDALDLAASH